MRRIAVCGRRRHLVVGLDHDGQDAVLRVGGWLLLDERHGRWRSRPSLTAQPLTVLQPGHSREVVCPQCHQILATQDDDLLRVIDHDRQAVLVLWPVASGNIGN